MIQGRGQIEGDRDRKREAEGGWTIIICQIEAIQTLLVTL
jgi:hypothetical protein